MLSFERLTESNLLTAFPCSEVSSKFTALMLDFFLPICTVACLKGFLILGRVTDSETLRDVGYTVSNRLSSIVSALRYSFDLGIAVWKIWSGTAWSTLCGELGIEGLWIIFSSFRLGVLICNYYLLINSSLNFSSDSVLCTRWNGLVLTAVSKLERSCSKFSWLSLRPFRIFFIWRFLCDKSEAVLSEVTIVECILVSL